MISDTDNGVKVWASLGMTINLSNYENQKVDMGISGIPIDASDEFIAEQLNKATMTLERVINALATEMAKRLREDYGKKLVKA